MTCASCAQTIEKSIRKLDGVVGVNVNFATEKLTMSYEPQLLRVSDIKKAVENAGYKAIEEKDTNEDADKIRKEKEIKTLWRKFIVSAIFTIPLLYPDYSSN